MNSYVKFTHQLGRIIDKTVPHYGRYVWCQIQSPDVVGAIGINGGKLPDKFRHTVNINGPRYGELAVIDTDQVELLPCFGDARVVGFDEWLRGVIGCPEDMWGIIPPEIMPPDPGSRMPRTVVEGGGVSRPPPPRIYQ